ncbi:MAG TPA: SMC family ATPase [Nitrososphaerales archaeon]|nr:SMC family ATPase [Nitrososphaerales archaeon]
MLVRQLVLRNIRSYNSDEEVEVEIPEGVILFEGDVGSGKSTLLYAIEFALFGFSDVKGGHLLSEGRSQGHVEVSFCAEGKEYVVKRGLRRRGDDVVQEECYIAAEGSKVKLSPSDLKQRTVSILRFNEPTHPRAYSLVYRYAVFTPQEQMKEILLQDSDTRLQVIRRVLGVQGYQVAADNAELVGRRIGELSTGLRKASEDLQDEKSELEARTKALQGLDSRLPELVREEAEAQEHVERLESHWKELRDKREEMSAVTGKIPILRARIADLQSHQEGDSRRIQELKDRLEHDIKPAAADFEARSRPRKDSMGLDSELEEARGELRSLERSMSVLETQLQEFSDIIQKGVCPVCGRAIQEGFSARSDHAAEEAKRIRAEIARLEQVVSALTRESREAREFEEDERAYRKLSRERSEVEKDLLRLKNAVEKAAAELPTLEGELKEAAAQVEAMRGLSETILRLDADLAKARRASSSARDARTKAETEKVNVARDAERLSKSVKRKESMMLEAQKLTDHRNWLDGYFRPTLAAIEKVTLTQANSRFNFHFQRFYSSLVDDPDMVVRVKEDFSPVFERQGFEQEYEALSGGERTSMALAYRFALNSVVREDDSLHTELVILDEPTDGFSKEQVYKMRDLLAELNAQQVIVVSHEKELESMADHIFLVEKSNGTSKVSRS